VIRQHGLNLETFQESHQLAGLFGRVCAARLAEPKKLDHVQAAFAQFEACNQTAFAPEFGR
jgi:hypothetical protein